MRMRGVADEALQVAKDASGEASVAVLDEVAGAASVEWEVAATGLKETIVLDASPDTAELEYRYVLQASSGLAARVRTDGSIVFDDARGREAFEVPAGWMADSATPVAAVSEAVSYDLTPTGSGRWDLTVTPDPQWLADTARVFPVRIDPSVSIPASATLACVLAKNAPDTSFCGDGQTRLFAGRVNAAGNRQRSLVYFDTTELKDAQANILSARVQLTMDYRLSGSTPMTTRLFRVGKAYNGSATWNSPGSSASWSPGIAGNPLSANSSDARIDNGSTLGVKVYSGLQGAVQGWVNGPSVNQGLVLMADPESKDQLFGYVSPSSSNDAAQRPVMVVSYNLDQDRPQDAGKRDFWTYESRTISDAMSAKVNIGTGNLLLSAKDASVSGVNGGGPEPQPVLQLRLCHGRVQLHGSRLVEQSGQLGAT